jgi:hypothetical protein
LAVRRSASRGSPVTGALASAVCRRSCRSPASACRAAKHGLTFPVGHGADARAVADVTGAFVNPDPVLLQSTGFVLDPVGKMVVSVYSSGAIGRLVPDDVIGLVRHLRQHKTA